MRNSSRTWLYRENAAFAATIAPGSMVLDAGAGEQWYRPLFANSNYESADFEKVDKPYAKSTYVCDLTSIPVEDERFDGVLFNQVMEHLPEPLLALNELKRVMKPGARMICTAPFFYDEHERPYDFYRYTQFGWRYLLGKSGLEIERLAWMEGYFGTVAYQLEKASLDLPARPSLIAPGVPGWLACPILVVARPVFRLLAHLFYRIDEKTRYTAAGFPKNYVLIARKPHGNSLEGASRIDRQV